MRRVVDTLSGDLFASIPKAHPKIPGGWRFRGEIEERIDRYRLGKPHVMGAAIAAE